MRVEIIAALVVVVCAAATVNAQRLLSLPEIELCDNRPKQWNYGGHFYYFSWDQEQLRPNPKNGKLEGEKVDWLKARNECRKRCMDAVGIETEGENEMIFKFLRDRNITYIWTSGRLCDFTGCDTREDLKPLPVNGFFWSNTNTKMAPTNSKPPGWRIQPWSQKGHTGGPQPDNAEFDINQTSESCVGVLNNIYNDGIAWHDIACYHKKPYICEDSDELLQYVEGLKRQQQFEQSQKPTQAKNDNRRKGGSGQGGNQGQGRRPIQFQGQNNNQGQGQRRIQFQGQGRSLSQQARDHFG